MAFGTKVQGPLYNGENAAAVTKAWTSGPTEGNLLIAIGRGSTNITDASITDWQLAISAQWGSTGFLGIWFKEAGASEGDVTLNWTSSTRTEINLYEFSEIPTPTLDKTAKTDTTGGTVTSRSSGTTENTTADDEVCIAGLAIGSTTTAQSWTNSYIDGGLETWITRSAYLIQSAAAAQETTCSWTTARLAGACIATFKAGGESSSTSSSSSTTSSSTTSSSTTSSSSSSESVSSSSTSSSSTTSSSSSTSIPPLPGPWAFGEQSPTEGESPVSWATWSDGAAGAPTIVGDANWGKLQLVVGEEGRSAVYDIGDNLERIYTVTENRYGTGQGSATLQVRGDTVSFTQDQGEPPNWESYTEPVTRSWRYIQVREVTGFALVGRAIVGSDIMG